MKNEVNKSVPGSTLPWVVTSLIGILIGLLLTIPAVWADYEAASYGFEKRSVSPLQGLLCPILIGRNERQVVSIRISNPSGKIISPTVKTVLSTSALPDSKVEFIKLFPGEGIVVQRTVGPENVDLGQFIFVNAQVSTIYPLPDQENTCGIFVLPFATNGGLVVVLGTTLSILCMAASLFVLYKRGVPPTQLRSLLLIVGITVLVMFVGFMGWWLPATMLLAVLIVASWSLISTILLRI